MRQLLLAGGVAVAAVHGQIDARERAAIDRFFGPGTCDKLSVEALQRELEPRAERVRQSVPALRRQQVLRDLCVIAQADGEVTADERELLYRIAKAAGVDPARVDCSLVAPVMLD